MAKPLIRMTLNFIADNGSDASITFDTREDVVEMLHGRLSGDEFGLAHSIIDELRHFAESVDASREDDGPMLDDFGR